MPVRILRRVGRCHSGGGVKAMRLSRIVLEMVAVLVMGRERRRILERDGSGSCANRWVGIVRLCCVGVVRTCAQAATNLSLIALVQFGVMRIL